MILTTMGKRGRFVTRFSRTGGHSAHPFWRRHHRLRLLLARSNEPCSGPGDTDKRRNGEARNAPCSCSIEVAPMNRLRPAQMRARRRAGQDSYAVSCRGPWCSQRPRSREGQPPFPRAGRVCPGPRVTGQHESSCSRAPVRGVPRRAAPPSAHRSPAPLRTARRPALAPVAAGTDNPRSRAL